MKGIIVSELEKENENEMANGLVFLMCGMRLGMARKSIICNKRIVDRRF